MVGSKRLASQVKTKQRVSAHGEVFTNEREVKAMLDLARQEAERIEARFLEPACGNGNFLAEILKRKLSIVKTRYTAKPSDWEKYAFLAISSVYGIELLPDNAQDCRERLFALFQQEYLTVTESVNCDYLRAIEFVINRNVLCGDALTLLQNNGEPIIFSEWSIISGTKVKRRDFRLDELLDGSADEVQPSLFGVSGSAITEWDYDTETNAFIPKPIAEFSPMDICEVGA